MDYLHGLLYAKEGLISRNEPPTLRKWWLHRQTRTTLQGDHQEFSSNNVPHRPLLSRLWTRLVRRLLCLSAQPVPSFARLPVELQMVLWDLVHDEVIKWFSGNVGRSLEYSHLSNPPMITLMSDLGVDRSFA